MNIFHTSWQEQTNCSADMLELGNRILMMDSGDIVLDIKEEEKKGLTVEGLLDKFKVGAGKKLDNDRILLSNE